MRSGNAQASATSDDESAGSIAAAGGITMTSLDPDELEAKINFDRMHADCR
jgi:hypothetical protein